MRIKRIVRCVLTYVRYPVVASYLRFLGSKNFTIDKGLQINRLSKLFIGNNVAIGRHARFLLIPEYCGKHYNPRIVIGNNVSIGNRFSALSADDIIIEDNNLIASDVLITSENHGVDIEESESYASTQLITAPVVIKKGCWIGEKVSIMPGVVLGERCIVAANAVVTHSFPQKTIIAGIPAKAVKRYDDIEHRWKQVINDEI